MPGLDTFLERRRKMSYSSKAMAEDEEEECLFIRAEQDEIRPSPTKRIAFRFNLPERNKKDVRDERRRLQKKRPQTGQ
ncbi:hypothetical protein AGABI1DRAFT_125438 [Agaricus bisporus var. burnettii JB137-S8]|uniref:Uncharacterized protein n=1 Tax=Agaricus bisporus var. burnettii (strain JB137-S8 / ATCC MYA-4627 / FGSC 10392) TaxID=597362 RepID=K5Y4J4_AGABU|nr:hypothetical protein AGABI2DRAFT_190714 [Agaricus bisporus var. bisporus H97]XP_007326837.1 uncharacterized protein AGABI1DRAFT_125438 [Agaricus bisporus var. burnettii JB137-S8]EKM82960.1 hypothetical protein AGABI1DRAFT_125438 [Agaricus bisporus var. burnettii JB137-S8]EKV50391.1 hypothetical protein AGABI2DRAFT_190714 [Agaricus bisporus var. bisporus H97]